MQDDSRAVKIPHNLILEDRHLLTVAGVSDVDSFDEQTVVLYTDMGELTVKGEDLHINKLNVDSGELAVEGMIHSLIYTDDHANKNAGFLSKLFR